MNDNYIFCSYLAHGNSVKNEAFLFLIGKSTFYKILPEVCKAIYDSLAPIYLKFPNTEELRYISEGFKNKYNFNHACGACDGKHVRIKCPKGSHSLFWNYLEAFL